MRYEFDGFQPIAMTGGTAAHSAIQANIIFSLTGRLRQGRHGPRRGLRGAQREHRTSGCLRQNPEYRATPSIQRYIILEQTQAAAVVFARKGEDWISEVVTDEGVLRMPEIGVEVPLMELYADIDLTAEADIEAASEP